MHQGGNYQDWGRLFLGNSLIIINELEGFFPKNLQFDPPTTITLKRVAKISARIQLFYNCNNKSVHNNCNTTSLLRTELRNPSYLVF